MPKSLFLVLDGIEWVNGMRVAGDRKITLTEDEARFDLDHGRIAPATKSKPAKQENDA